MQQRNRITYIQDLGEETAWKAVIWKTQMYFIYTPIMVYLILFAVAEIILIQTINSKQCGRKQSCPNVMHYTGICLKGLR